MSDLISRQVLDLWNRYKPTIAVDAIEYDRELKKLLSTNLASLGTDCISRQSAIDALRKLREEDIEDYGCEIPEGFNQDHLDRATFAIKQLPPIQPKRGKWIDRGEHGDWEWQADGRGKHWHEWECNTCHHYYAERSFFCPHCGADMRGVTT